MTVLGIDRVQVAAPLECEDDARAFYCGLLGLAELDSKRRIWQPRLALVSTPAGPDHET